MHPAVANKQIMSQDTIGIIAGLGQFPALVANTARANGLRVAICGFNGYTDPALRAVADDFTLIPLGKINQLLRFFKKVGATRLCMAGAIEKPRVLDIRPDARLLLILFRLRGLGDDAVLRAFAAELEKEGFELVQASSLVPGLTAPEGVLTKRPPSPKEWEEILFGWDKARAIGRLDIGQCIVVRQNMVMAVECLEGTDETLRRGAALGGKGCVAIKIFKPGQDERLDQPALGLTTIRVLAENNFSCLAYEANRTLFFDREECIAEADKHGICVIGLDPAGPPQAITAGKPASESA